MSFFKDLKEDIAQSVNELAESLDDNLEITAEPAGPAEEPLAEVASLAGEQTEELLFEPEAMEEAETVPEWTEAAPEEAEEEAEDDMEVEDFESEDPITEEQEEETVSETGKEEVVEEIIEEAEVMQEEPSEAQEEETQEVTVITKGTIITGGIKSDTSLVVKGTIEGDVECQGKLTITGKVAGNTIASEIYVNTPRLEGDINSKGIVKIDVGTVVIGKISCTSVLVAGAVKGDIEVNGPVIIDSTAVVKGDIKAKAIQINSGAVIDGHCALSYADVDLDSFFE